MVNIRNTNEIILNLIDFYRLVKPELDTKPGTVTRDIFISPLATQLSSLYSELANISANQSLRLVIGSDLDKLARNFGLARQVSRPASGLAIITFNSIDGNVAINKGDLVFSQNGIPFAINSSTIVNASNANFYRGVAAKYRADLDNLGITDQFAVELSVTASTPGISGNIAKYSLSRTNIIGSSNVLNVNAFNGGSDPENDAAFRDRVLSTFSGSSVGTNLGYFNTSASVSGVTDIYIVEPNDPLMTRDGTVVEKNSEGTLTIVKEGNGGKVDIVVLGSNIIEATDSFIYLDKSNSSDATNSLNDYTIGQILGDENKTVSKKRVDNLATGILPTQPVSDIVQITGSLSGSNFKEKTVDEFGRVSGNYELVKDTGYYAGSPWGFDKLKWISNTISDFQEDRIKNQTNGQDTLTYSDVTKISKIEQSVLVTNENSKVTSDRSIIQLLHYPITNVTRVFNTNTGERYIVTNQNLDGSGSINTTGRIKISGSTLPSATDILQVDYNWIVTYDNHLDFDGLKNTNNSRIVDDSIDWGYGSLVRNEKVLFSLDNTSSYFVGSTTLPASSVISCFSFNQYTGYVSKVTSGKYIDRLKVSLSNLDLEPTSVFSIKLRYSNQELYNTKNNDGLFQATSTLFNSNVYYNFEIILPTDTTAQENDFVTVKTNNLDVFTVDNISGSISGFNISIPTANINTSQSSLYLNVNYIANTNNSLNTTTSNLPSSKLANGFLNNFSGGQLTNLTNNLRSQNAIVKQNTDGDLYVELDVSSINFTVEIISIFNITNTNEYWNADNLGTLENTNQLYQAILSGYNSPAIGDNVIVLYYPKELSRFQPLNYSNELLLYRFNQIKFDGSNYYLPLNSFVDDTSIDYSIIRESDGYELFTGTDGYILDDGYEYSLFGASLDFSFIPSIFNYKLKINGLNKGVYDITSFDDSSNLLTITKDFTNINTNNIFAIRIKDNKELPVTIDLSNNKLILSGSYTINDYVVICFYSYDLLKNSSSKLLCTLSDNIVNPGSITFVGNVLYKATDVLFTGIYSDGRVNFAEAIRKYLGLNSNSAISSSIKLVNVVSLEKVTTNGDVILTKDYEYNLFNASINEDRYFNNLIKDSSLSSLDIKLNEPTVVGDKLLSTFYFIIENDSETINFTRNGNQYTNKKFIYLNKIVGAGFRSSQSTRIVLSLFNQPNGSSRYKAFYDYVAPKQNERITLRYNYNKIIGDVTFANESTRPINADVLVKEASKLSVDLEILILITLTNGLTESTVVQNVTNAVTNLVNVLELGRVLEDADIQNSAESIDGVDRCRLIYFNKTGQSGSVVKLVSQNNEYFELNKLTINTEFR